MRGQPDALRFAARERVGAAFERQVIEADIVQKAQARNDFLGDPIGDFLLRAGQHQRLEKVQRLAQRCGGHFIDRALLAAVADLDVARFDAQSRTVARRALLAVDELGQLFLDRVRIGFAIAPLQVVDDAFECMLAHHRTAALVDIREWNDLLAGAVQHRLLRAVGQFFEGCVEVEFVELGQVGQHLEIELVAPVPAFDCTAGQRQVREGDDTFRIKKFDVAEAIAFGAGTHRIVEREQPWFEFLQRVAASRASEFIRIDMLDGAIHFKRQRAAIGQPQSGLETLGQALLDVGLDLDPVDHDIDRMLLGFLQFRQVVDFVNLCRLHAALDPESHKALRLHLLEQVDMLAFTVRYHRRHDHQLGVFRHRQHRVDHL
ncbi:hypothetical protein IMCC9480_3291 [Oxalobacteraceae bacterium IMCC9480]|nr:hypothetical protein IMCC9480_3291 [Oxalobacteraceae bacterium IMCC9480]